MKRVPRYRARETLVGLLLMAPVTIPIVVFVLLPTILVAVMSLQEWNLITDDPTFIGRANYLELTADRTWWQALTQTGYLAALTVPTTTGLGLTLAWMLFRHKHTAFVEGVIFAPYVLPPVATILTWAWIFNPSFGAFNTLLTNLRLPTVDWLGDPRAIVPAMAVYTVWQATGLSMVLFLGGLGRVPKSVFEAAALDGAGSWTILRRIVAPLISPTTYVVLVISTVSAVKVFAVSFIFTSGTGGPGLSGLTVSLYQYQQAFVNFRAGYGSAISIALSAILLALVAAGIVLGRRRVFYQ